jgi:hypothetical protein
MPRAFFALPLLLVLLSSGIQAQRASLPGCEPPPGLQQIIKDQFDSKEFHRLDYQQRQERARLLRAKYPGEITFYRRWVWKSR